MIRFTDAHLEDKCVDPLISVLEYLDYVGRAANGDVEYPSKEDLANWLIDIQQRLPRTAPAIQNVVKNLVGPLRHPLQRPLQRAEDYGLTGTVYDALCHIPTGPIMEAALEAFADCECASRTVLYQSFSSMPHAAPQPAKPTPKKSTRKA